MADKILAIFSTLAIAVVVTTLVMPGRQTPAVLKAAGDLFANSSRAAMGLK